MVSETCRSCWTKSGAEIHGDHAFIPLDELLSFIVDLHFTDAS